MLLGSMPPMPMGGAEMQAIRLYKKLQEQGIDVKIITWGKLWHKKRGEYAEVPFVRIKSVFNFIIDIPSLFKKEKPKASVETTKIVYDDKTEITNRVVSKVWFGMIVRYTVFYFNCLVYLWFRRHQFDIIHAHMMEWPAFIAVRIGKKLKKKVVIKDSTMNGIFNLLRYPDGRKKQEEIIKYAHCVAMTRMIYQSYLSAGVPREKIDVIPNGIEITPRPQKDVAWGNTVIFVGNLTQQPAKGVDILLYAWKEVIKSVPNATLNIVGNGDIGSYKKFCISEGIAGSVIFHGKQQNVKALLLGSDIFVLPSRREGMSNALMEAMLCGMPVVATEVSGSEDLIEHNISGILVPVSDIAELAKGLVFMLKNEDDARKMGFNAYQRVVDKCDMNTVARQYIQLYHKISGTI
jgi:glycosyltransferase involved in cell wall biosynthesis